VPLTLPTTITARELMESDWLTRSWIWWPAHFYYCWHAYLALFVASGCLGALLFKPQEYDREGMLIGFIASSGFAALLFGLRYFESRRKANKRAGRLNSNPGTAVIDQGGILIAYDNGDIRFLDWAASRRVVLAHTSLTFQQPKKNFVLAISSLNSHDRAALLNLLRQTLPPDKFVEHEA
jgi:hypothetical protein